MSYKKKHISHRQSGFSLIELSLTIVVFGIILAVVSYLILAMNNTVSGSKAAKTQDSTLISMNYNDGGQATLKKALLFYIKNNSRLPCPDVNNDGLEDCDIANHVGNLPYRDLGYSAPVVDSRNNPVRYGVYRNVNPTAADDADLTVNQDRFAPTFPGDPPGNDPAVVPTTANIIDFCKALENSWATGLNDANLVHTTDTANNPNNVAYVLAVGGQNDADSNGSFFDGINNTGLGFENSAKLETGTYDDLVSTESPLHLYQQLNCVTRIAEVNGAALDAQVSEAAAIAAATSVSNAEGALADAIITRNDAIFTIVLTTVSLLNATFNVFATATEISEWNFVSIVSAVTAGISLAKAIADLVIYAIRLDAAVQGVADAQATLDAYNAKLPIANTFAKQRLDYAILVEANGGFK